MTTTPAYSARRPARRLSLPVRGLRYQVLQWGEATPDRPPLVMLHGWMDVAASFQFVVDALPEAACVVAPDWRGFGGSAVPGADSYWFPDYLGDLDALLDALWPDGQRVDIAGHSMGGNVAMVYAGVRPERVRRLINLEGFGMPETRPAQAPQRYRTWLDELRTPQQLRSYGSVDEVAQRLMHNNPRLSAERAAWLAPHWSRQLEDGRWHVLGDPAHKRVNPVLYRKDEALACWQRIEAPVLWLEGAETDVLRRWGPRYAREEFDARLSVVPNLQRIVVPACAHMLHHDRPDLVAQHLWAFVDRA